MFVLSLLRVLKFVYNSNVFRNTQSKSYSCEDILGQLIRKIFLHIPGFSGSDQASVVLSVSTMYLLNFTVHTYTVYSCISVSVFDDDDNEG